MFHFQECRQNQLALTGQLETVFLEMLLECFEFFDGFGHGKNFQVQKKDIKPQPANLVKNYFVCFLITEGI